MPPLLRNSRTRRKPPLRRKRKRPRGHQGSFCFNVQALCGAPYPGTNSATNMASSENKTARTLADLGVTQPTQVSALFLEVRTRFDSDSLSARDESSWKLFRDSWLGRKSGVLTQITDHWLKPATPELKRAVGAALNELRAHVESQIEARRVAIESGAEEADSAK